MIDPEQHPQALRALKQLIVEAKDQAYAARHNSLAELLNDIELLPEFLAEDADRTTEFHEMLECIVRLHPRCRYALEEFERLSTNTN